METIRDQEVETIQRSLKELKEAFNKLDTLWSENTDLCDEILTPFYPFRDSFDELNINVSEWYRLTSNK